MPTRPPGQHLTSILTAVILTLGVATSCSATSNGTPIAGSSARETETPEPPGTDDGSQPPLAPPVDNPLEVTSFLTAPCSVLSEPQLATLGIETPGIPTTTGDIAKSAGPYCTWDATSGLGSSIGVGFYTSNKGGLSDNYRVRDEVGYFEPTTVDGYPAVFTERNDRRDSGACTIVVGISDTMTFRASEIGQLTAQAACERAKDVATAALSTMRDAT